MKNFLADIFGRQVPQQIVRQNAIQSELYRTRKEIETKMAVPIASTGTPISELNGMARTLAIMANMATIHCNRRAWRQGWSRAHD
jgi:hypothetical protein